MFDGAGDVASAPPRPKRLYTADEVEQIAPARPAPRAKRAALARVEAQTAQACALAEIAAACVRPCRRWPRSAHEHRVGSAELALACGPQDRRRRAATASPKRRCSAALVALAREIEAAPRLVRRAPRPNWLERLQARWKRPPQADRLRRPIVVRADAGLPRAAFMLDWGDGAASLRSRRPPPSASAQALRRGAGRRRPARRTPDPHRPLAKAEPMADDRHRMNLDEFGPDDGAARADAPDDEDKTATDLAPVFDVPVNISAVLGRASLSVAQLLQLGQGSVLELDRKVGEAIDIYVNNRLVARGEVVDRRRPPGRDHDGNHQGRRQRGLNGGGRRRRTTMRLLVVGQLSGQLSTAVKMAMSAGAKVATWRPARPATHALRAGQGADLLMVDYELDIAGLIAANEAERIRVPVVACGVGADPKQRRPTPSAPAPRNSSPCRPRPS